MKSPLTNEQIVRRRCIRCGKPGYATWNVCADGNRARVLCAECDIELNELVLLWAGMRGRVAKIAAYRARVRARARAMRSG